MFPFWDLAIAPLLDAVRARRIVEIGALRGETTILMLDRLGPDAELHVIDPVPEFDPAEHEARFPGRYIFHRDLSVNVLPTLGPMDAALIDGDHNWYTVYNELCMLRATARASDAQLPVMVLHDVGWPYGRRDLYYAPEQIPEESRQPYAQRGMRPDKKKLLAGGGLNPTMHNAITEGGPRNGVMTAVDDFIAEHDEPLRCIVLPIYFGLAILVEEARIAREPELAKVLAWLESSEGRLELMKLSEDTRLKAMIFQHNVLRRDEKLLSRLAKRYLDTVKAALLNEHYIDHELRIAHLMESLEKNKKPEDVKLRDPIRYNKELSRPLLAARRSGVIGDATVDASSYFPYTRMGRVRLDHLEQCLEIVRAAQVPGDVIECGTGRGGGAIFMRAFLEARNIPNVQVWVADEFRASPRSGEQHDSRLPGGGHGFPNLLADLNNVRDGFERFDLLDDRVRFLQGSFGQTLPDAPLEQIALLRIAEAPPADVHDILGALYDRVAVGGFVVVDQYAIPELREVVEEFRTDHLVTDVVERIDAGGAFWRKTAVAATTPPAIPARPARAPLAPSIPIAPKDLSVVVVFYNMRREAERTLHSLSRSYQRDVEDLDYEVIVVENGSSEQQRLGEEYVRGFGPEFVYVDLGEEATKSPVDALNRGIAIAAGGAFALMIDGAHVLTPGVLRFGMTGLETYKHALVATQQWYVGPGQQGDAMAGGYDQDYEDRLFRTIEWPTEGYRLFEIGHFIGDRDWFDGVWESNCMFAPRKLLEQVGCFDENFSMPGGGYANLELYERLGSSPDVTVATIIGEGSFHQVHGGTTTNQTDTDERRRRIASYARHFDEIRGRAFRGPGKTMHYVGSMHPNALRTKARRRTAKAFKVGRGNSDGLQIEPLPIPEELREEFTDAYWRSLSWQGTRWLGHSVETPPTDLFAYQELIAQLRPDWIIETRTGTGGRALFLASILEMSGHGHVLSIGAEEHPDRPQHSRNRYLTMDPSADATGRAVREIVGEQPNALVIIGSRARRSVVLKEFNLYSPLVPVGSYVVIEDTIVNGHPVWPSFGAGPAEVVKTIMNTRGDFAPDPAIEKHGLSFNPNGFMKRLS